MSTPSILEIILMSLIALIVVLYCIKSILQMIDRKKNPQKYKDKKQKEREELDE